MKKPDKEQRFNNLLKVTQLQRRYLATEKDSGSNFAECCIDLRGDAPLTNWERQSWHSSHKFLESGVESVFRTPKYHVHE